MVPPPALTVLMSIIGTARSRPSILPRLATNGSPSLISATSQDVPPMSKVMMFWKPRHAARIGARGHAAGRPRQHGRHRLARGGGEGRHAAVRLHDVFLPRGEAGLVQAAVELRDVARQDRLQVGVDDGRAQPVVLADLRHDVGRQRDAAVRHLLERRSRARASRVPDAGTRTAGTPQATRSSARRARARSRAAPPRRAARSTLPRKSTRSFTSPVRLCGTSSAGLSNITSNSAAP